MKLSKWVLLPIAITVSLAANADELPYTVTFAEGATGNLVKQINPASMPAAATGARYHYMDTQEGPDVQADHVYIADDPSDASRQKIILYREKQQMGRVSTLGEANAAPQTKITAKANAEQAVTYCRLKVGEQCEVRLQDGTADTGKPFAVIRRNR